MAKTLCYGATYSSLSFCLPQNLSPSLALFSICFCPSTYLITTFSAFPKQTDLTSDQYKIHEPFFRSPVSKKNQKKKPRHLPLPPLGPPRQLSPACHKNSRSKTSLQKFRPLPVWLPAQASSCTVTSSSPKTIKWSFLLNQFSGAAIRLPAPRAAIRLPVRPPSDRSQHYDNDHDYGTSY
jgi:hypothetical protein